MSPRREHVFDEAYDLDEEQLDFSGRLEVQRTDWSLQRTLWSAERTLNSWLRTAMAAVIASLGIAQFIDPETLGWVSTAVSAVFAASGVAMYVYGLVRYRQELRQLEREGVIATPLWVVVVIVLPLVIAAVLALLLVIGGPN